METPSKTIISVTSSEKENPFVRKIPTALMLPASLSLRASAFLLDYILLLLILAVAISLALIFKTSSPDIANLIINSGYILTAAFVIWNWGVLPVRNGQRIGQHLVGIKTVRADGAPISYQTILLRHFIGYPISLICFGLGFLWMVVDARQRGWHDKLAGTLIVKNGQ